LSRPLVTVALVAVAVLALAPLAVMLTRISGADLAELFSARTASLLGRTILLGGSTTHGFGVANDQTIDTHMREILAERFPGIRSEVVNLALGGYDSYQVFERMRSDGVGLAPDVVIVNSGINDVRNAQFSDLRIPDPRTLIWEGNMQRMREEAERGGPTLWARVLHHSYAARLPGLYLENLTRKETIATARRIGPIEVDHGETGCKTPDAASYINKTVDYRKKKAAKKKR